MLIAGMLPAEVHESLVGNTQLLTQGAEVLLDEIAVKAIVTRRHRGVGGEDDLAGNLTRGAVEIQTFFLHAIANRFQDREATVSLIEVEDAGRNAHGLECTKATDAKEQLLTNAGAGVAAIQARGQFQIFG